MLNISNCTTEVILKDLKKENLRLHKECVERIEQQIKDYKTIKDLQEELSKNEGKTKSIVGRR